MSLPRLRAPQDDGEVLLFPPAQAVGSIIEPNRQRLNSPIPVLSRPLNDYRWQAIAEVIETALAELQANGEPAPATNCDSLFLAGHQPDLFHPGVWLKNFALGSLAQAYGATPLNLIVDCDTVKHTAITAPDWDIDPEKVRRTSVAFDDFASPIPYEERAVRDDAMFANFANSMRSLTENWPHQPLLPLFWTEVQKQRRRTAVLGEVFAAARRTIERGWGTHNLEVRLSSVCRTPSFGEFAIGVLRSLPQFHDAYNSAVRAYRRRHRIRNAQHPVPDLARDGEWLEAPFWAWRTDAPRRERLFVRRNGGRFELRAGRQQWPDLPANDDSTAWARLEREGFKVRTRALTTTLFARLLLADVFIHGIGGGKYDELTDDLMQRFFGIEPPAILVATGTLYLPLPQFGGTTAELQAARRELRDLDWNPQRHLDSGNWAAQHAALTRQHPKTKHDKRMHFAAFRAMNERMRPLVAIDRVKAFERARRFDLEVAANEVLGSREYAFVLHSETRLKEFLKQFQQVW